MVDWSKGAALDLDVTVYSQPAQNIRVVAKELQLLIDHLHDEVGVRYEDVHLIGHSLGAQTAGLAGQFLSSRIGRISGKNPIKTPNVFQILTVAKKRRN